MQMSSILLVLLKIIYRATQVFTNLGGLGLLCLYFKGQIWKFRVFIDVVC